ncbi:MAG TPA: hypothetical protein PK895_00075, partial [Bacteroidales bacterium]|nr:hypothetical protein [Bacteroidales bacterium]HOG31832.1 hypothetical protein [Bacteroidales bacterium]
WNLLHQIWNSYFLIHCITVIYKFSISKMAREVPPPFVWCCEAAYFKRQKPLAHRLVDHQAVVGAAIRTNDNVAATTRSGSLGKKQQGGSTCLWFFRSLQLKLKHVVEIVV